MWILNHSKIYLASWRSLSAIFSGKTGKKKMKNTILSWSTSLIIWTYTFTVFFNNFCNNISLFLSLPTYHGNFLKCNFLFLASSMRATCWSWCSWLVVWSFHIFLSSLLVRFWKFKDFLSACWRRKSNKH